MARTVTEKRSLKNPGKTPLKTQRKVTQDKNQPKNTFYYPDKEEDTLDQEEQLVTPIDDENINPNAQ